MKSSLHDVGDAQSLRRKGINICKTSLLDQCNQALTACQALEFSLAGHHSLLLHDQVHHAELLNDIHHAMSTQHRCLWHGKASCREFN
jgi:hypothetical protein